MGADPLQMLANFLCIAENLKGASTSWLLIVGLSLAAVFSLASIGNRAGKQESQAKSSILDTVTSPHSTFTISSCAINLLILTFILAGDLEVGNNPSPYGTLKSRQEYDEHIKGTENAIIHGDIQKAKEHLSSALRLSGIPSEETAKAQHYLAKIWADEGRFLEARPLAQIAAGLYHDKPEYINSYAHILINICEIESAINILENLEEYKDNRSGELLGLARDRLLDCAKGKY